MKKYLTLSFILKLVVAVILLQTLFFKFTGAAESKYIFDKIGLEPWGRIGSGVLELIASILLFVPGMTWLGALLALGSVTGGILFHLKFGIVVMDDGGTLFILACIVFVSSLILLWKERTNIPVVKKWFAA